jgi:small conductance mechanosensitive channel
MGSRSRLVAFLAFVVLAGSPAPVRAQSATAPAAVTPTATATPTTEQLQQLVATLKDDKARTQLVDELQTLIAAQDETAKTATPSPFAWFATLPAQFDAVGGEVLAAAPVLIQAPRIVGWVEDQASDPDLRQRWFDITAKLVAIFGAGLIGGVATRLLMRRPSRLLGARSNGGTSAALITLALAIVVELLPILVFAAVAGFVMPLAKAGPSSHGVASVLIAATVWAGAISALARVALLSPASQQLYDLGAETRNYLYIWIRRFTTWAAYGYAASLSAWWLGAPGAIDGLLLRITVLVLAILAIIFVLQNRSAVAEWLKGRDTGDGGWRTLRHRLAETWHILALVYVIGTFGVFMLNAEGGFSLLLRATALSLVVVAAAALLVRFSERAFRTVLAVDPQVKARFPALETRANRYTAILTFVSSTTIYVLAGLALMQAWGLDVIAWVRDIAEHKATGSIVSLALLAVCGLVLWELFSAAIERKLAGIDHGGRSRARTLLPLLRTTVLVILIGVAALMVLSEIGLNIAPLLAGAGIAGVAVGFGAQALVKDVITGFFFLLEDTFAVGDLVDVGKGHVGMIESMSIRNFRLRDAAGIVHTVPFSEVASVLNMSRDFAYVVCDAGIAYRESPDQAIAALREAGQELAESEAWKRYVLAPIEIMGLDRFTDTAMVIRARIKAAPPRQLEMAREFNRLVKKTFDRRGIEMASVNQLNYVTQLVDQEKSASPLASASSASTSRT